MTHRYRRLIGPGIVSLFMLLVLLGLGTWQVHRLAWKQAILARIAQAEAAPPAPLRVQPDPYTPDPYTKVSVTGRFRRDLAALLGAEVRDTPSGPQMGAELIVPLERDGAEPVLVDRGWIPTPAPPPTEVDWPSGTTTVTGYVQPSEKGGMFTPAPDLAGRHFYAPDTAVIALALGLPKPAPFTVIAMGPTVAGRYPIPAQHLPRPPNNHLEYALTWYGLAGVLVVMFATWSRKALKE
ncbi:MAG TPA: SURF1 family protein [Acetobacteraceae bacterium]|nr:SURF1 family protein [Acetobacteraceae bacterium]